jgi:hypothetical protein
MNKEERIKYEGLIPELTPGTPDLMDRFNAMRGKTSNTRAEQIRGMRDQMRSLNTVKLRSWGGHPDYGDEQPSAANSPETAAEPARRREPAANGGALGSPKRANYQRDGLPAENLGMTGVGQGPQGMRGSTAATPEPPLSNDEAPSEVISNDDGTFDIAESGGQVHRGVKIGPAKLAWMRAHPDEWNVK